MAGRWTGGKVVGEYLLGRRIGSGSFSVVWYAQHRLQGTEVAIKEIAMDRLSRKLQDNLLQEIVVLKKINHPNIISLHDIIETPGKIFLVLELCKGGDLSVLIQRHGRISETKAKYFMQQLASGLQVLRDTNLIHRDLKPQNLLLSRNDDDAVLKIADFGFARSLQPRGLADTLCGSPLYMAPEIMQLLKYDAKADLWSVGVILFQLVTGRTPFTGSNQIQLLQNILRSTELQFPVHVNQLSGDCIDLCQKLLRRNPVERLTFEEFFSHPFLSQSLWKESTSPAPPKGMVDALFDVHSPASPPNTNIQDDGLPFILDDLHEKPIIQADETMVKPTIGFSVGAKVGSAQAISQLLRTDSPPENKPKQTLEMTSSRVDHCKSSLGNINEFKALVDMEGSNIPEDRNVIDSLEFIDREYVLVSAFGPLEASSSSIAPSRPCNSPPESENLPASCPKPCAISSPMSIWSITGKPHAMESLESHSSHPSVTSQGSMDMGEVIEQPSSHCMTRIKSLQLCAYAITALVNERVVSRPLEAFSIQLVILAIWKQALHICHAQAASATEGSPSQDARLRGSTRRNHVQDSRESNVSTDSIDPDIQSDIEKAFLSEVETAEDLAKNLESDDTTVMPDAMEVIFHSALTLGRNGAVEELMDNMESATALYSKAVQLLHFLLVEAPSLFLNPPFSLTATDRYRLRSYIEILNNRHNRYRSQRMDLLKSEAHQQSL